MTAVNRSLAVRRQWRWGLLAITVAALALRLAYVLLVVGDDPPLGDAIYYSAQAETITRGEGFTHPFFGVPAADHPPATAAILALASFGGGDPLFEQRLLMAVVGTLAVVAIAHLGREVGRTAVGLATGALAAVYPGLWINDGLAMSETPTALVTAVLLLVTIRWHRAAAPGWLVGVVGGLAVLTRAELGLLLGLLVLPVLFGRAGSRDPDAAPRPLPARLRGVGAVVLASALVVAPWTIRNVMRFEEPVLISTNDGLTLIGTNCDAAYYEGVGFWHLSCAPPAEGDQSQVSKQYRALAIEYAADHLDRLPVVMAARVGRVWGVFRPEDMVYLNQGEGRPQPASRMAMWSWWFLAPVAGVGLALVRRRRGPWWPLLAPAVAVTATAILTYGIPRFRLPAEVPLLVAAAVAITAGMARALPPAIATRFELPPPRHGLRRDGS